MSHVIDFITGFESLIDEYQTQRKPVSPEAIYTNSTLKLHGITPSSVGGLENFITEGASKVWKAICEFFAWLKDVFTGRTKAKEDELLKDIQKNAAEFRERAEKSNEALKEKLQENLRKSAAVHVKRLNELNAKLANHCDKIARTGVVIDAIDAALVNISDPEEKVKPNPEVAEKTKKVINEVDIKKHAAYKLDETSEKMIANLKDNYMEGFTATSITISEATKILGSIKLNSGPDIEKIRKLMSNFMSSFIKTRLVSKEAFMELSSSLSIAASTEQLARIVTNTFAGYKTGIENSRKAIEKMNSDAQALHKELSEIIKKSSTENNNLSREVISLDSNVASMVRTTTDNHYEMVKGLAEITALVEKFNTGDTKVIKSIQELDEFMNN